MKNITLSIQITACAANEYEGSAEVEVTIPVDTLDLEKAVSSKELKEAKETVQDSINEAIYEYLLNNGYIKLDEELS
jgi:hypothetical protein